MVFADDNAKVLELLRRSFSRIGMQIQTCMTIEELSKNLAEKEADVLVIEENMEGRNGVDFCMSIAGKYPKMLKLVSIDSISREILEAKKICRETTVRQKCAGSSQRMPKRAVYVIKVNLRIPGLKVLL